MEPSSSSSSSAAPSSNKRGPKKGQNKEFMDLFRTRKIDPNYYKSITGYYPKYLTEQEKSEYEAAEAAAQVAKTLQPAPNAPIAPAPAPAPIHQQAPAPAPEPVPAPQPTIAPLLVLVSQFLRPAPAIQSIMTAPASIALPAQVSHVPSDYIYDDIQLFAFRPEADRYIFLGTGEPDVMDESILYRL